MTNTPAKGPGDEDVQQVASVARRAFDRLLTTMDLLIDQLECGDTDALGIVRGETSDMRRLVVHILEERTRLEKAYDRNAPAAGGAELDLDEARSEIGRRLARLRDATGT